MSFLWERYIKDGKISNEFARDSGVLPALRKGAGAEPGTVPEMWRYYTTLGVKETPPSQLWAEHLCLTVFGIHQQGEHTWSVHDENVGFGKALRVLRDSGQFSTDALDARVERLATATQRDEIGQHLISLVRLMRSTRSRTAFDYTQLYWDLRNLQSELKAGQVRRRWGAQYFSYSANDKNLDSKES